MATKKQTQLKIINKPHPTKGEDGPPLALTKENRTLLAIADGMGGRGATKVTIGKNEYSHARVAAYATLEKIKTLFETGMTGDEIKSSLENKTQFEGLPKSQSMLRGSANDDYPTTVVFVIITEEKTDFVIDIFWAGDSKAFIFLSDEVVVTKDHDRSNTTNPYSPTGLEHVSLTGKASFAHTSPLTRFLAATKRHEIEKETVKVSKDKFRGVLLASDGLFDYMNAADRGLSIETILAILQGDSLEKAFPPGVQGDDISVAIMQYENISSKSNPASSSLGAIALAGLVGYLIGKK